MKLITLVSGALLAASFALWIAPTSAFAQRNRSGLTPPPPPPYDTTQLGKWAEVGPAKLAACLALAAQGDVAGAAKNVETLIESADADLKVRLQSELDRLIGLEEARDAWVNQLRMDKAYLRLPVEGKNGRLQSRSHRRGENPLHQGAQGRGLLGHVGAFPGLDGRKPWAQTEQDRAPLVGGLSTGSGASRMGSGPSSRAWTKIS